LPYKFFKGEKKIYTSYTQMKNGDTLPSIIEETRFDIKMKCPRCNKILKLDAPLEVYPPNPYTESESTSDFAVKTHFQLQCNRPSCEFQYLGAVESGVYDISFTIMPIDEDWYFWVKEVE